MTEAANSPNHLEVDWSKVARVTCEVLHHYRYTYTGPVRGLRQRLVMIPPDAHGDQKLLWHALDVRGVPDPGYDLVWEEDEFNNRVCQVVAHEVDDAIDFEVRYRVVRRRGAAGCSDGWDVARYLEHTPLTAPDDALRAAADEIRHASADPLERAEMAHDWCASALRYQTGVTGVHTTAAEALRLGAGVCQDYAHILLSLLRQLDIPARYVSGQLLGEGVPHAWVEALVSGEVVGYDPTHRRRVRLDAIIVAVGRDFVDVSPTSGVYWGSALGQLTSSKQARILALEYEGAQGRLPAAA